MIDRKEVARLEVSDAYFPPHHFVSYINDGQVSESNNEVQDLKIEFPLA
jgi:hypothetical protein